MFITKKHLSRRTFLRGAGVTLALPLLDSMFPALGRTARAQATDDVPRFVGIFNPHGWSPAHWAMDPGPLSSGLPYVLQPLEPWKDTVTVFSGLDATSSMPNEGEAGGDHSRSAATFSGIKPKKTVSADIHLGTTIDQRIAQKYGQDNLLPSIQLKAEDQTVLATCPWGYSCSYVNSLSWAGPARPLPHEANPHVVFERLFGDGSSPEERMKRRQARASILDAVSYEAARLNQDLPGSDRSRLDQYMEDIREIERRLQNARNADLSLADAVEVPFGIPELFTDHLNLLWDMQVLAFQADITRVSMLMYAHDVSVRSYPESGVATPNHPASHHGARPDRVADWARINQFHVERLAYFLDKLNSSPDGDGTLLDHTLIFWSSNMGDSNTHTHTDVANMFIGGASGRHKGGRHIRASGTTSNLLLTALHLFGIEEESIGDSTGALSLG